MDSRYTNYIDFYQQGPYAEFVAETRLEPGSAIQMARVNQPAGQFPDPPMPVFTLLLLTSGCCGSTVDLGMGPRRARCEPGYFSVAPPDTSTNFLVDGPHGLLIGAMNASQVSDILSERAPAFHDFGRLHETPMIDPLINQIMHSLWQEAEAGNLNGRLFADAAVTMMVLALYSSATGSSPVTGTPNNGLADWRLRRVIEYMRANLDRDVGLAELSGVAKLSPAHFCRAFKTATGLSPIQKLIAMRMERACDLLSDQRLPIIHISAMCGYESPSRFAKLFRRATGLSPSAWRMARLK